MRTVDDPLAIERELAASLEEAELLEARIRETSGPTRAMLREVLDEVRIEQSMLHDRLLLARVRSHGGRAG